MNIHFKPSSMKVRKTGKSDRGAVLRLAEELMPQEALESERIKSLETALNDHDYELWVAEFNGEIVGFIDQWVIRDFAHGANLSFIQNLYVTPKHRRKGIGEKLLQQIIKSAEDRGVKEIHVSTRFENKPAIKLYKNMDF